MLHFESHCIMGCKCRYVFSLYVMRIENYVIEMCVFINRIKNKQKKPKSSGASKAIKIKIYLQKCTAEHLRFLRTVLL